MFTDSLCDSSWANRSWANRSWANHSWANHSHRGWTTLISFALQAIVMGSLFLLPLLYTAGLPRPQWMAALVAPARASAPQAPAPRERGVTSIVSNVASDMRLMTPHRIPTSIASGDNATLAPSADPTASPTGFSGTGEVLNSIGNGRDTLLPAPPPPAPRSEP